MVRSSTYVFAVVRLPKASTIFRTDFVSKTGAAPGPALLLQSEKEAATAAMETGLYTVCMIYNMHWLFDIGTMCVCWTFSSRNPLSGRIVPDVILCEYVCCVSALDCSKRGFHILDFFNFCCAF